MTHLARTIPFGTLFGDLEQAVIDGHVSRRVSDDGLLLYCYTKKCVYDRAWTPTTLLARGIILDPTARRVVATPFPKFFNHGEMNSEFPDLPYEVMEKLDGSLIILFHHNGKWRTATKGSFISEQAEWAQKQLGGYPVDLDPDITYLLEGIYPENRIVVQYDFEGLVLLAAYDGLGKELNYAELKDEASLMGWRVAKRYQFESFDSMASYINEMDASEEGFVLSFANGIRLKLKGAEYRRLHAMIDGITPLNIWQMMLDGVDTVAYRTEIPEEFATDFDAIVGILFDKKQSLQEQIAAFHQDTKDLSDKELGLKLPTLPESVRKFIFRYRKDGWKFLVGGSLTRATFFKQFRPTGNVLEGYRPSLAINKVQDDE